ncbi:hypothetical protein COEREDRAFT_5530 [Coemansia reversa NRRL 1564]|uniref:BAP29/BAP31 transmembrane domain-containing protein n=1 Tax=Coemansia reversa (strain ATCC 12441 / NRRL 1564) TaxID=763665 RepID=A0A2G5BL30_COERN|nr:hypothetical protein COEREDRAFT_5530 [Coemansia reversa NRRL 1564]|eukprot:PIA19719.1 hypothetical protein COEREDRAFT_5530 [Coemansia reversa NRRL 1564]
MFFTLLPLLFAMFLFGLAFSFPPVKRNILIAFSLLVTLTWGFTFTQATPSSYAYPTRATLPVNSPIPKTAPTETPLSDHFEWLSNIVDAPVPMPWIDSRELSAMFDIIYKHMPASIVLYFVFAIILVVVVIGLADVVGNTHFHLAQMQTQLDTQVIKATAIEQLLNKAVLQLENKFEAKLEVLSLNEKQIDANSTQIDDVQKVLHDIVATLKAKCGQTARRKATIDTNTKAIDTLNNQMEIVVKTLTALLNDPY